MVIGDSPRVGRRELEESNIFNHAQPGCGGGDTV